MSWMTSFLLVFLLLSPATATVTVYFGEDEGASDGQPLEEYPNSQAARDEFLLQVGQYAIHDFETWEHGQTTPITLDFGLAGSAQMAGTGMVMERVEGTYGGTYPISGTKFWLVDNPSGPYTLSFDKPQSALGFYATDVGDYQAQIVITLDSVTEIVVPATVGGPSGGVMFFGLLSQSEFTNVTITATVEIDGIGYDDIVVGIAHVPTPITKVSWGLLKIENTRD